MARPQVLVSAPINERLAVDVGATTTLELGDLISFESNVAVLMDAATEDATFAGYLLNRTTADAEPDRAIVGLRGIVTYDATSATYESFAELKYASENTLVAASSANTIAWVAKRGTTITRVDTYIDVPALGKLFTASA